MMWNEAGRAGLQVSVIYLVWVPAGEEAVRQFVSSYAACPGGMPHVLIVAYKGYANSAELAPFQRLLSEVAHQELLLPDAVLDIDAYFTAARSVAHEYVCFLNTASRLLDADWLHKLFIHGSNASVGVAGASGSWHGKHSAGTRENYRLWRHYALNTVRTAHRNIHYEAFPNPHIRTNAFLIARERFLNLNCSPIRGKEDAHRFEHGKRSMTRQLHAQGLKTLLVGCDGKAYDVDEWARSDTFWQGDQSNLLVSDNRTRSYEEADSASRQQMGRLVWGLEAH